MKVNGRQRGAGGQLQVVSLVDTGSVSNHMAKHRSAVSVYCRGKNAASACNAGGSSSLHTRMNAAARLMQPLQCTATDLKTSQRLLQHASITQRTQALARQAQRTAQRARCYSRTCTFSTRPRVTRSITNSAQLFGMFAIPAGSVASRWHAIATQLSIRRTRPHGEHSATTQPRGGSACCRRSCAKNHFWHLMSLSGRMICARSCAGVSTLPSATRASDTGVSVRPSVNEREMDVVEEVDSSHEARLRKRKSRVCSFCTRSLLHNFFPGCMPISPNVSFSRVKICNFCKCFY
jgi:hypothetical protein